MVELFGQAVSKYAEKPAYECFGKTLTYAEIDRAANAVAAWLQTKLGVKRGDRIALMCPNVFAFPIAMHGIMRAGAAQVNVKDTAKVLKMTRTGVAWFAVGCGMGAYEHALRYATTLARYVTEFHYYGTGCFDAAGRDPVLESVLAEISIVASRP